MKTLRYNTETRNFTTHQGQYKTYDGNFGRIDPPWVQLEVIETEKPEIDPVTQKVSMSYEIQVNEGEHDLTGINGTATEVWTVEDKTEKEVIAYHEQAAQTAEEALKAKANERVIGAEVKQIYTEAEALTDEQATEQVDTFPPFRIGINYKKGQRFQWNGKLWKVLQDHTSAAQYRPDEAVSLYEHVYVAPPGDVCDTSPAWDSNNWGSYTVGYLVRHNNSVYEAINTSHTWVAPAKSGDGAISWKWIKDCN